VLCIYHIRADGSDRIIGEHIGLAQEIDHLVVTIQNPAFTDHIGDIDQLQKIYDHIIAKMADGTYNQKRIILNMSWSYLLDTSRPLLKEYVRMSTSKYRDLCHMVPELWN
jgi:hypothetical protein